MLKPAVRILPILPLCLLGTLSVQAAPLVITFETTASGELDGISFTDETFVITATGDTGNRFAFSNGFSIPSDSTGNEKRQADD